MNNPQIVTPIPDRLLPLGEVMLQIGYRSRTSVYRDLKGDPRFPKPIYRGRNVFFLASEVAYYIAELALSARAEEQVDQIKAGQETAARLNRARQSKAMRWREMREARKAALGSNPVPVVKRASGGVS